MSHDRPTHAERAAAAEHDPRTCFICLNPDKHGDQAEDATEAGLRAELAAAKRERDVFRLQMQELASESCQLLKESIEAEREACAKLVDLWPAVGSTSDIAHASWAIAAAIRARGSK